MRTKHCYAATVAAILVLWQMVPVLWALDVPPGGPDLRLVFDPDTGEWKLTMDVDETVYIRVDGITLNGDGHTIGGAWNGIVVSRADETISNVTIKNVTVVNCPWNGVYADDATGMYVENINASNNGTGISLQATTGSTVVNSTASNNSAAGIELFRADGNILTDITCQNNGGAGVALVESYDNALESVTATGNNDGILLDGSSRNVVASSTLTGNTWAGVAEFYSWGNTIEDSLLAFNYWAVFQQNSDETSIVGNIVSDNDGYAVYSSGCGNTAISGNTVERNPVAFSAASPAAFTVGFNDFRENDVILDLTDAIDFTCFNNNFYGQPVFEISGGSGIQFNGDPPPGGPGGNWYENNTGPDENQDGIVDTPFVIYEGVYDFFPWVQPDGWFGPSPDPQPDIEVQPPQNIEITVELGGTQEAILTIANEGEEDSELHVNSVELYWVPGDDYIPLQLYEWDGPATLKHGETTQVKLIADATDCSDLGPPISYLMFIRSDDPDEHVVSVLVRVNVVAPPPPATPAEAIQRLIDQVGALNLQKGIDNSLDAKLDAALGALDDVNANNDVAAINMLQAFINAVEAQRGNKISDGDADALIATAQEIINLLSAL